MDKIISDIHKSFIDNHRELLDAYRKNNCGYTAIIKRLIEKTIRDNTDNKRAYPEYFRIDYTGWEKSGKHKDSSSAIFIYDKWSFKYAIEHENNDKDWTYELLKLSFVRADVRVVIGYVDRDKCKNEKEVIKAQVENFNYGVCDNEEFYVILMNRVYKENDPIPFGMKVYSIKDKSVEEINV